MSIEESAECKKDGVTHALVREGEQHHEDFRENYAN